jgi:hypothetical protein
MTTHKKKNGNGHKLPFTVRGKVSAGCKFVVVKWRPGAKSRNVVSCPRLPSGQPHPRA